MSQLIILFHSSIKVHIGDVSTCFSPYTLNGHQFIGLGVESLPREGAGISDGGTAAITCRCRP